MTAVDDTNPDRRPFTTLDRWLVLSAMLVYAAAVSVYVIRSMSFAMPAYTGKYLSADEFDLILAGTTFFSIVGYALGFMLLTALLDIFSSRPLRLLTAMNFALAGTTTFELFRLPLLMMALQTWAWIAAIAS